MIEELTDIINSSSRNILDLPQRLSSAEYKRQQIAKAQRDIEYHAREHAKEIKHAEKQTSWVCALRDNLKRI